jgi:hypothetical protein
MRAFAALVSVLFLACPVAVAQPKKSAPPAEPAMQVHIVRNADPKCEPNCPQWIAAQGRIVPGTAAQFRKVLRQLGQRKLPVLIDSGGGAVNDALAIGRLIRAGGLTVAVTRTEFTPCAPTDTRCRKAKTAGELRGLAQGHLSKCASACAFVLAGGAQRLVGRGTGVGVHQISMTLLRYQVWTRRSFGVPVETRRTLVSRQKVGQSHAESRSTYARIAQYFAEMGIGDYVMTLIMQTPNDTIRWLNPGELHLTALATHFLTGEQLMAGVAPTPLPALPDGSGMPAPTGTADVIGSQVLCATYGICPPGTQDQPKFDYPGSLLPAKQPDPAPTPSALPPEASRPEQKP